MKKVIQISLTIIFTAIAVLTTYAQTNNVTLNKQIENFKSITENGSDAEKIVAYSDLMFALSYDDVKQSIAYGEKAFILADKLNVDTLKTYAHTTAYKIYSDWGQNIKALDHALIVLEIQTVINHKDRNTISNDIGDIYMELNDFENAYKAFKESLKLSKEKNDEFMEAITMFNIGRVYKVQANYDKALEYINDSKILSEKIGDIEGFAYSFYELGLISMIKDDLDESVEYLTKAVFLADSLNLDRLSAQSMVKIADAYRNQKSYLKSLENYHEALKENERIKDDKGMAETYLGLGSLQLEMNSIESASESLHKGLGYARNLSAEKLESQFYQMLSDFYDKKGDQTEALRYYKRFKTLSDSVFNRDINIQVALLQTQFESEKKDKEIAQLNENKALQNMQIEKQHAQTTVLLIGFGFLLVIVIVFISLGVNKRKANYILLEQTKQIEVKNQELGKLNRVKDKFFSIISHDLKSPFQSLSGVLELMSYNALSDQDINKLFKELKVKFDSTNYLLENLLEWARVQMQETKFDPNEIQLHKTIEEELSVVKNSNSKDVDLQNNVEKVSLAHADMNMFKLVIRNLVSNAVKFTKHKGNVEVLSEDMGDFVCISVKDNGVGISKENQQKLFSEEASFSTLGTALEAGTGLGLNLCKEFVEMHGGKIWVESEEGKGSTFKFTLKKAS